MDSLDSRVLMAPPTTTQVHKKSTWIPYHMDSRCILAVFWGSENQPGIQGIHVESLFIPWIPHGIHKECAGEGKELNPHGLRFWRVRHNTGDTEPIVGWHPDGTLYTVGADIHVPRLNSGVQREWAGLGMWVEADGHVSHDDVADNGRPALHRSR